MNSTPANHPQPHLLGFFSHTPPPPHGRGEQKPPAPNPLVAMSCGDCQHTHFPPETRCTHCRSERLEPVRLSGRAKLYSAEIASRPGELSFGQVLLEEGFWVRALLIGAFQNHDTLSARLKYAPVDVVPAVLRTQGLAIPAFKPRDADPGRCSPQ